MEQLMTRTPKELKALLQKVAERKGISLNAQMLDILWTWKKTLKREELLMLFDEKELTEIEIAIYGFKKKEN